MVKTAVKNVLSWHKKVSSEQKFSALQLNNGGLLHYEIRQLKKEKNKREKEKRKDESKNKPIDTSWSDTSSASMFQAQ